MLLRGGYRADTPGGYKEITVTIDEEAIGSHSVTALSTTTIKFTVYFRSSRRPKIFNWQVL